jgi:hypothetical protein
MIYLLDGLLAVVFTVACLVIRAILFPPVLSAGIRADIHDYYRRYNERVVAGAQDEVRKRT